MRLLSVTWTGRDLIRRSWRLTKPGIEYVFAFEDATADGDLRVAEIAFNTAA